MNPGAILADASYKYLKKKLTKEREFLILLIFFTMTIYSIQSNNRLKRIKTNQEQLGRSKHARQRGDSGCIGIR
jgi:hypothetical protein